MEAQMWRTFKQNFATGSCDFVVSDARRGDAGFRHRAFGDADSLGRMVEVRECNKGMRSKYDCDGTLRGLIQRFIVDSKYRNVPLP